MTSIGNNKGGLQKPSTSTQSQQLVLQQKAKIEINTTWMIPDSECWVQVGEEEASTETMFVQAKIKAKPSGISDSKSSTNNQQQEVEIKDINEGNYRLIQKMRVDWIHQVNQELPNGYNDMVEMDHLNEAEILINLQRRYQQDLIYTFIGPTLVVINPYKQIPVLFSKEVNNLFSSQAKHQGHIDYKKNPPHTYAVAAQSYCKLFEREKNQAIVISGESGAGKTENAKTCMSFLTGLSGYDGSRRGSGLSNSPSPINKKSSNIEDRILGCNPILEAFGNAKTVRNDNSSRFGKFVQIQVGKSSRKIKGATIANYLLEKSRVTTPGPGERNYHIFYHLLYCGQKQLLDDLHLIDQYSKPEQLNYLRGSNCFTVPTINDKALYDEVIEAFHTMGIIQEEQDTIFRIVSSILLIGNVQFDASTLTDTQPCRVKEENLLHTISTLLKVDYQSLLKTINTVTRKIGSSIIYSPKKLDEVISSRDSIARNMYERMFSWIVTRLNSAINLNSNTNSKSQSDNEAKLCIGLLDIFGFEVFDENSFEQFCINFTNEKLQQLYIQYVFKSEEQEFVNEGLSNYINQLGYKDNQNIIQVLDNPMGIFQLIDESSALAQSDDKKLYENILKYYNGKPEVRFSNRGVKKIFTIVHTAKPVDYCIDGFKEKNKAEVSQELSLTIAESNDPILSAIFLGIQETKKSKEEKVAILNQQQTQTKNSKENKFLGSKFRAQMKQLMDELIQADCHFIRCIKPNEQKRSNFFLQGYVLIQIKYLGVLQAILSRKEGFPYRKDFRVFFQQFSGMVGKYRSLNLQKIENQKLDLKEICIDILQQIFNKDVVKCVLVGKTKIFAKDDFGKMLDEMLYKWYEQKKEFVKKILKQFQVYTFKKNLKKNIKFILKAIKIFQRIQATYKMKKQRKQFLQIKKSTGLIFALLCKNLKKSQLKQWNLKTRQLIIAQKQKEREQAELMAAQKEKYDKEKAEKEELNQQNNEHNETNHTIQSQDTSNYQTLEKKGNFNSIVSDYATISNYNTFNAANNNNNYQEIKENYKALQDNYQSSKGEADNNEKMKQEYEQIQQQNREILDSDFDSQQPQKIKTKSKVEYFLNLDNPKINKPPPPEKSKDCSIDFTACNQETIKKIQQNNYIQIISELIATRKKNLNEVYSLKERMSYEKRPITKPLTSIYKPNEPAAVKAFTYMLKYAGDRSYEEEHPRVIAWKLLQLILEQDEQDVTDEIFLQSIKQLTNNTGNNIEEYFKLAALISSCTIMSPRIVFPAMNFFYEQANYYEDKGETRLMEWCKYILSRIGNSYNFDENNQLAYFIFKRDEMPLKEEFIAVENMNSIQLPIFFYGDRCKYYKVESYIKTCSLVSLIGLDLQIINQNHNWYGLVEYLTIDGITTTQILDFGMRILDWKAKKYRERQQYLSHNPGKTYEIKLYYQFIILHSIMSQDIDTNLMMYLTYANEYLHNIYFFDVDQKSKSNPKKIDNILVNKPSNDIDNNVTEIDFIVEMAAIKTISDYKVYKKDNIKLNQCIPPQKLSLLKPEVWRVKIEDQIDKLMPTLKTQRKARSHFLNKMKYYQGKYFFSQKFHCKFSRSSAQNLDYNDEVQAICLTKLGYVYLIQLQTNKELESISYRDIRDFSINYSSQSLYLHTSQFSYQIVSSYSLNIYYNITQYCSLIEELDNSIRMGMGDKPFDNDSNENLDQHYESQLQQNQQNIEEQESFNTSNKLTNDNIASESRIADYNSQRKMKQKNNEDLDEVSINNNNEHSPNSPYQSSNNKQNGMHIPDYTASKQRESYEQGDTSPNSQFSSGQNKLLNSRKKSDLKYLEGSKSNLNKQFQNMEVDSSNLDQTNRSCNLYENLI